MISILVGLSALAVPTHASTRASCRVELSVGRPSLSLSLDQQVGSEKLDCAADNSGQVTDVRVVRRARATAEAAARVNADARGRAEASCDEYCSVHFSGSCNCSSGGSCHVGDSRSCWASGRDWNSCSDSATGSGSDSSSKDTPFVVALAPVARLAAKGYTVRGGSPCQIFDQKGQPLNTLRAIGLVLVVSGEDMMAELISLSPELPPTKTAARAQGEALREISVLSEATR